MATAFSRKLAVSFAALLAIALTTVVLGSEADAVSESATFGTIPPDVMKGEMAVADLSVVPDYVAVWDQAGEHIAGYIKREELFAPLLDAAALQEDTPLLVVNTDKQEVGWWVHGVGFVPDGSK